MDDGKLIAAVQKYEELYNLEHPGYNNEERVEDIWKKIAKLLKKPAKECRGRWTRLRDNHCKTLQLRKTKSGQEATKPPKYDKELTFLVSSLLEEENRYATISSPTNVSVDNESEADDEANNDQDSDEQSETTSESISCTSSSRSSTPVLKKPRLETEKVAEAPPATSALQDFLNTRAKADADKIAGHKLAPDDPVTEFFINMAQTVKTFPLCDQIQIKSRLFQMVNLSELRLATALAHCISFLPTTAEMADANLLPAGLPPRYPKPQKRDSTPDGYFSDDSRDEFGRKCKDCIIPIEDEQINLNELYLPSGYFIKSGHRKFVINICGSTPKCGVNVAACEITDNNVIHLGYYTKLQILTKYSPNIGLKYLMKTNKDIYTTIEFKCNRHIESFIFKFVPEIAARKHHRFTFESAVFCVPRKIGCMVKNNYDSSQMDLGSLYKPMDNWMVKNSSENSDIYLNICGDLNPIGNGPKSRGAQVSLVDKTNNIVKGLGFLSEQIIINRGFVSANFSDGFECSTNKYFSTKVDFFCSFIEKGPEFVSNTNCEYFIRWFTPAACPHKVSTHNSCSFYDFVLGNIDLTKLYQKPTEKQISANDSLLKFNICGSLDSCNGRKDVSFCLVKNNTEIVFGKTSNTIISKDGFMRMEFHGDLCSSNHINRTVKLNFICDYSQIREEIQIIEECKIKINIYTHLVCPSSNAMRCKTNPVNGSYYDLSNFARLSNHNLEVLDPNDHNLTYVLRICKPVIYSKNSMCAQQTICVRNHSEPDLYKRFQMLGRQLEHPYIYTKNNSVILQLNGKVCPNYDEQPVFITKIEFRCSNKFNMLPVLKSKSACTHIFLWETKEACDIIKKYDKPYDTVSVHDFNTKSDKSVEIDNNNKDDSIIKDLVVVIKNNLLKHVINDEKENKPNDEDTKTESPKNAKSFVKEEESPNKIIKTVFQDNEPTKNVYINKVDREIKKNEDTNRKPLEESKDIQHNETPENVVTNEDLNETKLNVMDHKIFRSLLVPMNTVNSSGININNCTVTDKIHNFNMHSLSHIVNITSKSGKHYTINICNNTAEIACQNPFCKQNTLTNLFLMPNNRFISMRFTEKTKCNDGYYKSILFLKCSDDAQQPSIIKEDECSVHLEWKNKGTCSFFDLEDQTMSGSTKAAIATPVILVFLSVSAFLFYFWRKKQNTSTIDPTLKCFNRIHYTKVKDSAKIV